MKRTIIITGIFIILITSFFVGENTINAKEQEKKLESNFVKCDSVIAFYDTFKDNCKDYAKW